LARRRRIAVWSKSPLALTEICAAASSAAEAKLRFNRDIRPISRTNVLRITAPT